MFRNRTLQVDVVKKTNKEEVPEEGLGFEEKLDIVEKKTKKLFLAGGAFVLAYVLLDTVRQVAVEMAKND